MYKVTQLAHTSTPIFTISTSNDIVSRKDVAFGHPENKILHFDPIFPSIFWLIFDGTTKILCQKNFNNGDVYL